MEECLEAGGVMVPEEALVCCSMSHPTLVRAYGYAARALQGCPATGGAMPRPVPLHGCVSRLCHAHAGGSTCCRVHLPLAVSCPTLAAPTLHSAQRCTGSCMAHALVRAAGCTGLAPAAGSKPSDTAAPARRGCQVLRRAGLCAVFCLRGRSPDYLAAIIDCDYSTVVMLHGTPCSGAAEPMCARRAPLVRDMARHGGL